MLLMGAAMAGGSAGAQEDAATRFESLSQAFLERYLTEYPVTATRLGDHRFDGRWSDMNATARAERVQWLKEVHADLSALPTEDLDPEARVDAAILLHHLESSLFTMEVLRPWETNPLSAVGTVGSGLDYLAARDFAPLPQRMESLRQRLEGLPAYLADSPLEQPPRIHTQTAIDQNAALIRYVDVQLREQFAAVPDQSEALNRAADQAVAALKAHQSFLEDELRPRSTGDFRLGRETFDKKLQYALDTDMTAEEVLAQAWQLLDTTTAEMAEVAAELHPQMFPDEPAPEDPSELVRKVLDRIADDHPDDETLLAEARATLDEATAFVAEHGLVTLPDEECSIIEMPEFRRGVSIAYCDAPGPFEAARQTFYAIAPPPASWDDERRESFYREYNSSMLKELTVHEAMPGHYLQLAHAGKFDSPVRSVFGSGTFVEGWALYSEWMMVEQGFGGPRVKMQRLKMVLRLCINAILDHEVHAGTLDHDAALELMTGRGFQEVGEAEGKWTRACLTSAQLSTYLVGMLEVMELRRLAEARAGDAFDVRAYNDELLAHGSPAPRHLRVLLGLHGVE